LALLSMAVGDRQQGVIVDTRARPTVGTGRAGDNAERAASAAAASSAVS